MEDRQTLGLCAKCGGRCCYNPSDNGGYERTEEIIGALDACGLSWQTEDESKCPAWSSTGCRLPRESRPQICLDYICEFAHQVHYHKTDELCGKYLQDYHVVPSMGIALSQCTWVCGACPRFDDCPLFSGSDPAKLIHTKGVYHLEEAEEAMKSKNNGTPEVLCAAVQEIVGCCASPNQCTVCDLAENCMTYQYGETGRS